MVAETWAELPVYGAHAELLTSAAVLTAVAERQGVYSITSLDQLPADFEWAGERAVPSLAFPWRTPSGRELIQLRVDQPFETDSGVARYLWPKGSGSPIGVVRESANGPVIFVEGTKQALAAAGYLASGAVYAIAGCRTWSQDGVPEADLDVVEDRQAVVIFDADVATNPDVWEAAKRFRAALEAEGATDVRYVLLPAGGKAGLDDVLGKRAEDKRAPYLARLIGGAVGKLPAKPKAKARKATPSLGTAQRPAIAVNDDRLNVIDNVTACLRNRWDGTELFGFGGVLAWRDGGAMRPVTRDVFVDLVQQAATTVSVDDDGRMTYAEPTATVMAAALSRVRDFTPLDRLATVPFVRPDGTVCQTAGYDPATRTYLVDSLPVTVPDDPAAEDVAAAVKLLTVEWLGDLLASMPTPADQANALALVLTPLVRGLVPVAPMAVVNGLQMGVGKNLLGDMVSIFATGSTVVPLPWSGDDEERRKVILSTFRAGRELFVFDEAHVIEGASLARALTAATYTDRVLGVSNTAEFPNNVTWMSLGNNVQINGDMSRRVYVIRLAPAVENPMDRDVDSFRHPDLKGWTAEHRAELVAAGLTLIRAWFTAGSPQAPAGRRFGSFETWGGMLGGVLEVAGVPGFLDNLSEWRSESDYESRYWTDHLQWLEAAFGAEPFTAAEVVARMRRVSDVEHPPGLEDHTVTGYARALGKSYGKVKGRAYAGLRLELASASPKHANHWVVASATSEESGASTSHMDVSGSVRDEEGSGGMVSATYTRKNYSLAVRTNVRAQENGELASLLIPPDHSRETDNPSVDRTRPDVIRANGTRWQPEPDPARSPLAPVLHLASAPEPAVCPDCDGPVSLVPGPMPFWYACLACHPDTGHQGSV